MCNPFIRSLVSSSTAGGAPGAPAGVTPSEVHALIEALDRVPRHELPNGVTRLALTRAIVAGDVDAIYRPMGASVHNVCIAGLPPAVDPRMTLAQWVTCWRASVRPADVLLSEYRARVASSARTFQGPDVPRVTSSTDGTGPTDGQTEGGR